MVTDENYHELNTLFKKSKAKIVKIDYNVLEQTRWMQGSFPCN